MTSKILKRKNEKPKSQKKRRKAEKKKKAKKRKLFDFLRKAAQLSN